MPSSDGGARRARASLIQEGHLAVAPGATGRGYLSWVYQLNGRLDVEALVSAVDDVAARHDILRAGFVRDGDGLYLTVAPASPGITDVIEIRGDKRAALERSVADVDDAYDSLVAEREPGLRVMLSRIDDRTSVLAMFVAEALVDSESGPYVTAEISRAYAARANVPAPPGLPVPSLDSYVDYVAAHPVERADIDQARGHWRRQAEQVPPVAWWPAERSGVSASRAFNVSSEAWARVNAAARAWRTTPFALVLAALQVALSRVVGARHFAVGTVVTDRRHPSTRRLIGSFQSVVRIECRAEPGETFAEGVRRTTVAVREALAHCSLPAPLADPPGEPRQPAIHFYMFDRHGGPVFGGVRRRRFRLHQRSEEPLRLNCVARDDGTQDLVFTSATAPPGLVAEVASVVHDVLTGVAGDD